MEILTVLLLCLVGIILLKIAGFIKNVVFRILGLIATGLMLIRLFIFIQ